MQETWDASLKLDTRPNISKLSKLQLLTIALLTCSVILNLFLARQTKSLRSALLQVKAEDSLVVGASPPPIAAKGLDGQPATIRYGPDELPTILYVFKPSCGWCTKNIQNIRALAQSTKGRYRVIGLSLSSDNLQEYVTRSDLTFPVYSDLSPEVAIAYRMGSTPQTIVISSEGKLVKEWKGAYMGNIKKQIETQFGSELPGINQ
jgi:peroxiredoxin